MTTTDCATRMERPRKRILPDRCLAVVMPVYNEVNSVDAILERVANQDRVAAIHVVDDGSTDGTWERLQRWRTHAGPVHLLQHQSNRGKGAAIRTAISQVTAPVIIIQDADLEYDPVDYAPMLELIETDKADVVYGSRFSGQSRPAPLRWHTLGNRLLTWISNRATGLQLTDEATCYKMFKHEILSRISLEEDRFGFCPEVTAKVAGMNARIAEVAISYRGRTIAEGKKIRLRDGLDAIRCIVKYNWRRPLPGTDQAPGSLTHRRGSLPRSAALADPYESSAFQSRKRIRDPGDETDSGHDAE